MALYKHRTESELEEKSRELDSLLRVARILAQPVSFKEKCQMVLRELAQITQADIVTMRLSNQDATQLDLAARAGRATFDRQPPLAVDRSLSGLAFRTARMIVANDYPRHEAAEPTAVEQGIRSLVSLPVKIGRNTVGVVNVASAKKDHFPPHTTRVLEGITEGLGTN